MRANGETELRVERRVVTREQFGIGLVETVLELRAVGRLEPAAVYVMVHQRHVLDVLGQGRQTHTLQARRNFSARSSGLRSPKVSCS